MIPWQADLVVAAAIASLAIYGITRRALWIFGIIQLATAAGWVYIAYLAHDIEAMQARIDAAMQECKDAPPVVEFRQGMTLCPGQTVTMTITIPMGKDL